MNLHKQVAQSSGVAGVSGNENAYIKMQLALLLHTYDDLVTYASMSSTMAAFRRAGIDLKI